MCVVPQMKLVGISSLKAVVERMWSQCFQITARPDAKFGEIVVLIYNKVKDEASVRQVCEEALPTYWIPKAYIAVDELPMTGTGKPDRATARRLASL